jgi:hypothetical protein
MQRLRQIMVLSASGLGIAAALFAAPVAGADEDGGGGPGNPLLPTCETSGGSSAIGGQTTDCATPGNSQITATPNNLGTMGAEDGFYGFPGVF